MVGMKAALLVCRSFGGSSQARCRSWAVAHQDGNIAKPSLARITQIRGFGHELTQQVVGVFVCPPPLGYMKVRKPHIHRQKARRLWVVSGDDSPQFIAKFRCMAFTPHIAQNAPSSATDGTRTRHPRRALPWWRQNTNEGPLGRAAATSGMCKPPHRSLHRARNRFAPDAAKKPTSNRDNSTILISDLRLQPLPHTG
jgi:hypothetical protein